MTITEIVQGGIYSRSSKLPQRKVCLFVEGDRATPGNHVHYITPASRGFFTTTVEKFAAWAKERVR